MTISKNTLAVILYCYNNEEQILESIQALLCIKDITVQVYILDLNSTNEKTLTALNLLGKEGYNIFYKRSECNGVVLNNIISNSQAEFISIIDINNKFNPDFFEKGIFLLKKDSKIGLLYCDEVINKESPIFNKKENYTFLDLLNSNPIGNSILISREAWEVCNGFIEIDSLDTFEVWDFILRVSLSERNIHHIAIYCLEIIENNTYVADKEKEFLIYLTTKYPELYIKKIPELLTNSKIEATKSKRSILELNQKLSEKEKIISTQNYKIEKLETDVQFLKSGYENLEEELKWMRNTFFWTVRNYYVALKSPLRKSKNKYFYLKTTLKTILESNDPNTKVKLSKIDVFKKIIKVIIKNEKSYFSEAKKNPYSQWVLNNKWNDKKEEYLKARIEEAGTLGKYPKVSVIMPVYNPPIQYLKQALESVQNQIYKNWELCIADDCSPSAEIVDFLSQVANEDSRIKVTFRESTGNISKATNSAVELATGEFLVFLDHDDLLTPNALGEIAIYLINNPDTDFLYTDDDKINSDNNYRFDPQFKPDWSPELLLSYMYMGHIYSVRTSIFRKIGGMRIGFEGSQDFDLALRATEIARKIGHIPLILYHWRAIPGSTAVSGNEKPKSFEAGRKAVQESLSRRNISGIVKQPEWALKNGLGLYSIDFSDNGPTVSIIISTKNHLTLLKSCLESIQKTTYKNYEVLIADNISDDPTTIEYLKASPHKILKIPNPNGKFNYAYINNTAAKQVKSDYILFLNNDTEVVNPKWLSQMMGFIQIDGIGAVGAKLIYPDRKVQHAGVIKGLHNGLAGHAFKLLSESNSGYLCYASVNRNYSAVTAACMLTPKKLFEETGGFDEENYGVAYNDVDYCYRLQKKNYRIVYTPEALLIHKEGKSRGFIDNPVETFNFKRKYKNIKDPYYSPHLSLENEQFTIKPSHYFLGELKNPIKILICTHVLDYTGSPLHQFEIVKKLYTEGKIQPIVYSFSSGPLELEYRKLGIQVIVKKAHPLSKCNNFKNYQKCLSNLCEEIETLKVDTIYANTMETFVMVDCAKKLNISSIWNIHESTPWQSYFNYLNFQIGMEAIKCFQYPYKVVFVSNETRKLYESLNVHNNFTTIYNGLDLEKIINAKKVWSRENARNHLEVLPGEIVLLSLGTVCERKGQHDLAYALSEIPLELVSKIKIFIVGDRKSEYSSELHRIVGSLKEEIKSKIKIIEETKNIERYYAASDIFVCTSRIESYPRVIQEAMAFDLPIITTPVFGVKEQVQNNVNGLFYEPGDISKLTELIVSLLRHKEERDKLSNNASYVLGSLKDFDEMVEGYLNVFQEAYFI